MIRILTAAALVASLGGAALAQTIVTGPTEAMTTYGTMQGDDIMPGNVTTTTTRETTTVTMDAGRTYASDTVAETTADTSTYSRYFDDAGNPTYMPDVSFSLD